jgi:hypothetical protein
MRRPFLLSLALIIATAGCSGESDTPTSPGRGSLRMSVTPNPVVAKKVAGSDNTYDFPFEVMLTETGGRAVTVTALHVEVKALGVPVFSKSYDASYLQGQNYNPVIAANSTVRYNFTPRSDAPDAVFSSNVNADIQIEGRDDRGNAVRETETVSIRR